MLPIDKSFEPIINDNNIKPTVQSRYEALKKEWSSDQITSDSNLLKVLHGNGIYRRSDMRMLDTFYRFPRLDPYNLVTTTREYVFFVKPDLHLFDGGQLNHEIANRPFFNDLFYRGYSKILEQLQYSCDKTKPFINILSNRKTSNMDLPSISASTQETNQNQYGTKLNYRKGTESADENIDFSVEFEDTKYLEIYILFKAYDEYQKLKWYGTITPPNQNYIEYKVSHDKMSVFRFVVGEDGETILHWAQWWGVLPVSVPRDAFGEIPEDGHLKFTINFKADFMEDMNPETLNDFNYVAKFIGPTKTVPMYDSDNMIVNGENMRKPFVDLGYRNRNDSGSYSMNKLRWGV